ncbi:J domain-containing protein [Lysobacter capsici]|uniref:J domain-containing protein n=1 Tax=Lysobacter capsici TaxID=435897 RepID=UPI001C005D0E|nr:J domain-containing protein [Lysobacter capsici]QWF15136.1 J domain-containing protein [Lysobacter capsici]
MNPFEHLGIEPGADEREIKRAYARRLRQVRPDDDPAGFQALHEAYQACLGYAQHLRWQAMQDAQVESDDPAPASQASEHGDTAADAGVAAQAQAHGDRSRETRTDDEPDREADRKPDDTLDEPDELAPSLREFDFNAFMSELLQRAAYQPSAGLARWLRESEPLYSLDLKLALRAPVSQVLAQIERPLPVEATAVIFEFFSLDVVGEHDAWLHEHAAQARGRAESNQRFQYTLEALQSHRVKPVDRLLTRELARPRHWPRRVFIALVPLLPMRLIGALKALQGIDAQQAALQLNGESVSFWQRATDPLRLSPPRVAIASMRIVVYYLALIGLMNLLIADLAPSPVRDLSVAFAIWAGWACAQAASLRWWPTVLVERLDRRTVFSTVALIGAAVLAPIDPFVASGLGLVIALMAGSERSPTHGSLAQYATYAMCAALGTVLLLTTGSWRLTIPYALIGTGALHIIHSVAYAWYRGISVPQARTQAGWYWYLVGASGMAIAVGLYKMANG